MFPYIGAHLCELNTNPANKVARVMFLTFARWCACITDYMNKLEYVCLCWRLSGKNRKHTNSLISAIYITPAIKKNPSHQGTIKQRYSQVKYSFNYGNFSSDMTVINTRIFGIMFEDSLLNIHIHEQTSVYTH